MTTYEEKLIDEYERSIGRRGTWGGKLTKNFLNWLKEKYDNEYGLVNLSAYLSSEEIDKINHDKKSKGISKAEGSLLDKPGTEMRICGYCGSYLKEEMDHCPFCRTKIR